LKDAGVAELSGEGVVNWAVAHVWLILVIPFGKAAQAL
jgi:hypothetical protein